MQSALSYGSYIRTVPSAQETGTQFLDSYSRYLAAQLRQDPDNEGRSLSVRCLFALVLYHTTGVHTLALQQFSRVADSALSGRHTSMEISLPNRSTSVFIINALLPETLRNITVSVGLLGPPVRSKQKERGRSVCDRWLTTLTF